MNYQQTIAYLYSRLPMFTRIGNAAFKPGLDNIRAFCNLLRDPQDTFKTIHIGGTNGKGSTSHMLAAILHQAGYTTGLYTSPHLKDFRERIRVNGEMISEDFVTGFVEENIPLIGELSPSFFEVTVALAFQYFAARHVDVAVIEVGLGGRLDSTNIITPELSVITNISMDHMAQLGNTIAAIAGEKAGIIKPGIPVVIGEYAGESVPVFEQKAKETGSKLVFAEQEYGIKYAQRRNELLELTIGGKRQIQLSTDLTGTYQQKNVLTVLAAVDQLRKTGFNITDAHIIEALQHVKALTGLMGRWQQLDERPLTIADTGHNEAGISEVLKNIAEMKFDALHMVIGMVSDKDISKVLNLFVNDENAGKATFYFTAPDLERAMPAPELANQAMQIGLKGTVHQSVPLALTAARANANENDLIFIGGSTFVVAEAI